MLVTSTLTVSVPSLAQARLRWAEVGELEGGVAEAEAEGIERLALEVHVGAAVADVVVHHGRQLVDGFGPGDDEVAAGVVVAEEDLRERGAFVLRAVRHVQDGGMYAPATS